MPAEPPTTPPDPCAAAKASMPLVCSVGACTGLAEVPGGRCARHGGRPAVVPAAPPAPPAVPPAPCPYPRCRRTGSPFCPAHACRAPGCRNLGRGAERLCAAHRRCRAPGCIRLGPDDLCPFHAALKAPPAAPPARFPVPPVPPGRRQTCAHPDCIAASEPGRGLCEAHGVPRRAPETGPVEGAM